MKDGLLLLSVLAMLLAGFPLMRWIDRLIGETMVPPEENAEAPDSSREEAERARPR